MVSVGLAVGGIEQWTAAESNALLSSMAGSLGLPVEELKVEKVEFEVESAFDLAGVSAADWSPEAEKAFAQGMAAELGQPVQVLGVTQASGTAPGQRRRRRQLAADEGSSLRVDFVVRGLTNLDAAMRIQEGIVDVAKGTSAPAATAPAVGSANSSNTSAAAGGGSVGPAPSSPSPSSFSLMSSLTSALGKAPAVALPALPAVNADVTVDITVPEETQAAALSSKVKEVTSSGTLAEEMRAQGLSGAVKVSKDPVITVVLPPPAPPLPSPPPLSPPEVAVVLIPTNDGGNGGAVGAVVGAVAAVLLVASGAYLMWRRRRRNRVAQMMEGGSFNDTQATKEGAVSEMDEVSSMGGGREDYGHYPASPNESASLLGNGGSGGSGGGDDGDDGDSQGAKDPTPLRAPPPPPTAKEEARVTIARINTMSYYASLQELRLEQHMDTLKCAGIHELSHAADASEDDLTALGLKAIEARRLLRHAEVLKCAHAQE